MKQRRPALTITLALLMLTPILLLVNPTKANPYMASGTYLGEPTLPVITVLSPSEKLTYWVESDVWLDFAVIQPQQLGITPIQTLLMVGTLGK